MTNENGINLLSKSLFARRLRIIQTNIFFFSFLCELEKKCPTLENKNGTEEQDIARIGRAAAQPVLPPNIGVHPPNLPCFLQYFLANQPPDIRNNNLQNMRYICQELPNQQGIDYYASMHDEGVGIPVYSGYVLHAGNINFQAQGGFAWIETNGNVLACTLKPTEAEV